jgi:hypothetical protein
LSRVFSGHGGFPWGYLARTTTGTLRRTAEIISDARSNKRRTARPNVTAKISHKRPSEWGNRPAPPTTAPNYLATGLAIGPNCHSYSPHSGHLIANTSPSTLVSISRSCGGSHCRVAGPCSGKRGHSICSIASIRISRLATLKDSIQSLSGSPPGSVPNFVGAVPYSRLVLFNSRAVLIWSVWKNAPRVVRLVTRNGQMRYLVLRAMVLAIYWAEPASNAEAKASFKPTATWSANSATARAKLSRRRGTERELRRTECTHG